MLVSGNTPVLLIILLGISSSCLWRLSTPTTVMSSSNANVYLSTLRVSKAGYPLQVLVFPYTLIFSILVFVVHIRSHEESHRTNHCASSRYAKLTQNPDLHKLMHNFKVLQHMKIQRKPLYLQSVKNGRFERAETVKIISP